MFHRIHFLALLLAGVVQLVWTCPSVAQIRPGDDSAAVVAGNTQFAFDLYRQLAGQTNDDIFLSPLSISSAMAMAYGGARGQTAEEMADVFHFGLPQERLHPAVGGLMSELTGDGGQEHRLEIANRLWAQDGFGFHSSYLESTRTHYGAGLAELDFANETEASRLAINDWVEGKTHGRIQDLLPEGSLSYDTRLVLTNTVYFLGDWESPFPASSTATGPFHVSPMTTANIPMMRQRGMFAYTETPEFKMVEMDYKGDDVSMLVVLPKRVDGLGEVEQALTPEVLDAAIDSLTKKDLVLKLPKYGTTSEFNLSDALRDLGMPTAFSSAADFSGIADERLVISDVLHKAYLNVDEKGTEAAAATGVVFEVVSVPTASFFADHPFLFLIRDKSTESILFMGRVVSPTPPMTAVPEPASSLLAIMALVGLAAAARAQRRSAPA